MLVTPEVLADWLHQDEVRVFDCRFSLSDKEAGLRKYQEQHVPAAVYLDLEQDLSAPATAAEGRHPLPNPVSFALKMSRNGVGDETKVVVYDDGEGMAARAWWLLRYIGHQRVYVLDGGYSNWNRRGFPTTDEIPTSKPASLTVNLQSNMVVSETDVEQIVAGDQSGALLDARAAERYRGEVEPIDPKPGHIPGATNEPWNNGLREDGTWLSPEEQNKRFKGVVEMAETNGGVIHYCGSGVTACNNIFAMKLAGLDAGRLFPGSWSQWSGKSHHTIETSEN